MTHWRTLSTLLSEGCPAAQVMSIADGQGISLARFRDDVAAASRRLSGCRRGALVCQDSYRFAVGLFGLFQAGADVLLPANAQPGTLQALTGEWDRLVDDGLLAGDDTPAETPARPWRPLDADRTRITFFTSGSTGTPKAIQRTLGMLEREIAVLERMWGPRIGHGPVLATVSHQHLYGLTFKLLWPLAAGRPFFAGTHELWETLLADLPEGACVISSPAHLGRLGGLAPLAAHRRPVAVFSAGAPLSRSAAMDAEAILGHLPIEIFGSTETGAFASRRQRAGDETWTAFPGANIGVDDDGCLTLETPYTTGWVGTADRIQIVAQGFRFLGRADRIAKIEGKRISLTEVERILQALPWIDTAAAVVLPGDTPRLAAAATLTEAGRDRLAQLGRFRFGRMLRQEMAATSDPAGRPRLWRFVEALPLRAMGKRVDTDILALFTQVPP